MKGIAIPEERLFASIFNIRGHKVMLDADLAELEPAIKHQKKLANNK